VNKKTVLAAAIAATLGTPGIARGASYPMTLIRQEYYSEGEMDISTSTATFSYDTGTGLLTQTGGTYVVSYTFSPGQWIYRHEVTGLVVGNTAAATGTTFNCIEGNVNNLNYSWCGAYGFGSNQIDESTTTWGPGLAVARTLGGDDTACIDCDPVSIAYYDYWHVMNFDGTTLQFGRTDDYNGDPLNWITLVGNPPMIGVSDSVTPGNDYVVPFGSVLVGAQSNHNVTVTNKAGAGNLTIGQLAVTNALDSPFSIVNDGCSSQVLAPGATCHFALRFEPGGTGPFNDTFDVPSNDAVFPSLVMSVSGTGVAGGTTHLMQLDSIYREEGGAGFANISSSTATWTYDATNGILTQTGGTLDTLYPYVPPYDFYRRSVTGLVIGAGNPATATSYTCIEGNVGVLFGEHYCGNYSFGGNFANDSTVSWGPGTLTARTIGGDDTANGPIHSVASSDGFTTQSFDGNALVISNPSACGLYCPAETWTLHSIDDTDSDGVIDSQDNCTLLSNPSQVDSDADGYGNRCDGDMNQNGIVNSQDYVLFRQQFGQPSVAPTYNKADINANGVVNSQDYVLFRVLVGSPPGPSALAP